MLRHVFAHLSAVGCADFSTRFKRHNMTYGMVSMDKRCVTLKRYVPRRFSTAPTSTLRSYTSVNMLKHILFERYAVTLNMTTYKFRRFKRLIAL